MGSDPRSSAAPPHSFHIVSAKFMFSAPPSPFAMPLQHPNTGKTSRLGGFGPFFRISVFSFFSFRFSLFPISSFRFFGGLVSEETVPQHSVCVCVCVSYPSSPPKPKATHPKRPNAEWKMQPCKLIVAVGSPRKLSINADTDVLCVSTEATRRGSQRTEALRAIQSAGQAWTAVKGFDLVCTHKPDRSCRSMTGVCTSFEVPWTWEKESRGPKPKSLKKSRKSLPGQGPKSLKKVSKEVRKVKKNV